MGKVDLERAAGVLWGKSGDPHHSLLAHMLDTAAVTISVLEREPSRSRKLYSEDWELPLDDAIRFVAFLVALHDLGKASPTFQAVWPEGAQRVRQTGLCWDPEWEGKSTVHHGTLTDLYVMGVLRQLGMDPRVARRLAIALGAHHGFHVTERERDLARPYMKAEAPMWTDVRMYIVWRIRREVGSCRLPNVSVATPETMLRIMGLASFSDWIASATEYFSYGRDPLRPDFWRDSIERARHALDRIGWPVARRLSQRKFTELFPSLRAPNDVQKGVTELVRDAEDPVLVLIEAPMGMGKTEAALFACHILQVGVGHRGFYIALPTQATANGLFPRVAEFLGNLGVPVDLQLQHGTAVLNLDYRELLEKAKLAHVYDSPPSCKSGGITEHAEESGVLASEWLAAKKRAMLSSHGVGTLDQALLGVLKVKHHFIRLWGLMNRAVVLDEIHAYDTYTSGLLQSLIRWLKSLGSSVILMTATLTQRKRAELLSAWGAREASLPPYPRLAVFLTNGDVRAEGLSDIAVKRVIQIQRAPTGLPDLARVLKNCLPGTVGAIVNTVDRAQGLYQALGPGETITLSRLLDGYDIGLDRGPWLELRKACGKHGHYTVGKRLPDGTLIFLLHARFPAEERALREMVTLALFGKHGPRVEKAVLVATQVAEQSLDLDFDALYSDLAPIDLLLQRVGRLHRHERERPQGLKEPVLLVGGLGADPEFENGLYWSKIYEDYFLLSTWLTLRDREVLVLPTDIEALLEEVYERKPDSFPEEVRVRAEQSHRRLESTLKKESESAKNLSLADPDRLLLDHDAADLATDHRISDDVEDPITWRFLTRLGGPSVPVVPLYRGEDGWFADKDRTVPVPTRGQLSPEEVVAIWSRVVRLSRYPIPQALKGEDPPPAWQASGLLKGLKVLEVGRVFSMDRCSIRVDVDPELGVVYVPESPLLHGG